MSTSTPNNRLSNLPTGVLESIFTWLEPPEYASLRTTCRHLRDVTNVHASKMRLHADRIPANILQPAPLPLLAQVSLREVTILAENGRDCRPFCQLLMKHPASFQRVTKLVLELHGDVEIKQIFRTEMLIFHLADTLTAVTDLHISGLPANLVEAVCYDDDDKEELYPYHSPLTDFSRVTHLTITDSNYMFLPIPWMINLSSVRLRNLENVWWDFILTSNSDTFSNVTAVMEEFSMVDCTVDAMLCTLHDECFSNTPIEMLPWYAAQKVTFVRVSTVNEIAAFYDEEIGLSDTLPLQPNMTDLHVEDCSDILDILLAHPNLLSGLRTLTLFTDPLLDRDPYVFAWDRARDTLQHLTLCGCFSLEYLYELHNLLSLTIQLPVGWAGSAIFMKDFLQTYAKLERLSLHVVGDPTQVIPEVDYMDYDFDSMVPNTVTICKDLCKNFQHLCIKHMPEQPDHLNVDPPGTQLLYDGPI